MSEWRRRARAQKRALCEIYEKARLDGARTYAEVRKSLNELPVLRRILAAVRLACGRLS